MTRKEEILNYTKSFKGKGVENEELKDIIRLAILDGALWADRTMIDKVCEWLKGNLPYSAKPPYQVIEDLRKAMEE